jgi:hypothetical protein
MKSPRYLQAQLKTAQAKAHTKALSKSLQSQRRIKLFLYSKVIVFFHIQKKYNFLPYETLRY